MKFMARRAFFFSFICTLPIMGILDNSKLGKMISYDTVNTSKSLVQESIPVQKQPGEKLSRADSLLFLIYAAQTKANTKLDTGLKKQIEAIQNQRLLVNQILYMRKQVENLKIQVQVKSKIQSQVQKDADLGNSQHELFKMLLMIAVGLLISIGISVAILVSVRKP